MTAKSPLPDNRDVEEKHEDEELHQESALQHVIRTGLPPGIEEEELADPGRNIPKPTPSQAR